MRFRLFRTTTVLVIAAVLLALPACNSKYDGPGIGLTSKNKNQLMTSQNNLKQIALAMHGFHDANGNFPAGIYSKDGKIGLSWRVAILPYIEQQSLYMQFKLDEPWDSEHNKTLIQHMPKTYSPPGVETNGQTFYRAFSGSGTLMSLPRQDSRTTPGAVVQGPRMFDITDGTSNTAMVVEAGEPVIWTKPDDLEFKPDGPLPVLGGIFREGANIAFCDGSVRFVQRELPPATLKSLITINGGERFELP